MAYCCQRRFPPALEAESSDPGVFVRQLRGFEAGGPHGFGQNRWGVGPV